MLSFPECFNEKYHKNKGLTVRAAKTLAHLDWPGNIRELENLVENIVVLEQEEVMRAKHLQARYCKGNMQSGEVTVKGIMTYRSALEAMERQLLENARNQFGSTRKIADALDINQSTVSRKLRQYRLDDASVHRP